MRLVYARTRWLLRSRMFEIISFRGGRVPETSIICWGNSQILGDILDPCWETISSFAPRKSERDLAMF
jgi:hypothetical protein